MNGLGAFISMLMMMMSIIACTSGNMQTLPATVIFTFAAIEFTCFCANQTVEDDKEDSDDEW